jgi:hypothetical protein
LNTTKQHDDQLVLIAGLLASLGIYGLNALVDEDNDQPPLQFDTAVRSTYGTNSRHERAMDPPGIVERNGVNVSRSQIGANWATALRKPDQMRDPLLLDADEVADRFGDVFAKAKGGSASASLSIFRFAVACGLVDSYGAMTPAPANPSNACKELSRDGRPPTEWLLQAATGNVNEAAIPLLGVARGMARSNRPSKDLAHVSAAAISALEQAARQGSPEAYLLLGRTYSDGLIVQQDPTKAFAYFDALARATGDERAMREASTLRAQLRQADLLAAESLQNKLLAAVTAHRDNASAPSR